MPVTLSVQIRGAQLVRQGLQNLRSEIPRVGAEQIFNRLNIAKRRLQTPARPPDYPIRWDSERQRRAYFATRGFGGGIPHIRTGASELGWQLVRNPGSGLRVRAGYSLVNRTRGAGYIWGNAYGTQQSSIHRGRWELLRDILEEAVAGLPREIEEHIDMVARREGLSK